MKTMRTLLRSKLLLWIGIPIGILLLLIATLAIFLGTRSDAWWRDMLTTKLSQTLEREVEIQGEFRLDLGRTVTTEMAAVRISNPDWTESKDMLRLGSLLLEFDLLSVLGDTLRIHRLELTDLDLALEENQDGQKNWEFPVQSRPPPAEKQSKGITLPVHIEHLSLLRTQLSLRQPRWERPLVLAVEKISGGQSPDDNAVIDGNGRLGDLPFSFEGSLGKISSALNRGPVSYQLNGKLGEASLRSEGSIDSLTAPLRPRIELFLNAPEIMQITQALGAPKVSKGPIDAQINIMPDDDGVSGQINGKFGQLEVHADVAADSLDSTENLDVKARLSGENLATLSDLLGLPPLPKGPFEIDTVLQKDKSKTQIEKLIAGVGKHQISAEGVLGTWPRLKDTRLALQAKGPDLAEFTPIFRLTGLGELPAGVYSANVLIESGKSGLKVHPSRVQAGGYQATAEGQILTKHRVRAELKVTGSGPDLSMITRLVNTVQLPALPFQAEGKIALTANNINIIDASGTAGKHKVAADGQIAFSSKGPMRLDVKGSGLSLQAILKGLGYDVIPASAAYQVDGRVEIANNRFVVTAKQARLGPTDASAILSIPDLNTPTTLTVNVRELKTTDVATALALVGTKVDLQEVMPANLSGQITRTKDSTSLKQVSGNIGTATLKVDGRIGDPPDYHKTRLSMDIRGTHLEHFLDHPVDLTMPFEIKGAMSLDKKRFPRFDNMQLKLADIEARVDGKLGDWEKLEGAELTITAQGPNTDTLAAILERPLPAGAIKFDGHVKTTKNAFHIDRMNAQLGRNNLSGDLKLLRAEPPMLKGQVNSTFLDLAPLKKEVESEQTTDAKTNETTKTEVIEAEDSTPTPQTKPTLLIPDTPIKVEAFDQLNLDLKIRVDEVVNFWAMGPLYDLSASVLLKGRDLSVSDFEVRGERSGKLRGKLALRSTADLTHLDIDIKGKDVRLGLGAAPGQKVETYPPTEVEAKFNGAGNTYHKLAVSLNGRIKAIQGEGLVSNKTAAILLSDILYEVFETLNPFVKSEPTTQLDCGVYIVNLGDGKAKIQDIVIQTDKLTILSAGTIDLNTEDLNIEFQTRPRKGVGISASIITNPYIKLGGSLSKPALELNPERAAVATGIGLATAGLSFLYKGIWDRYFSSRDPCGDALKRDSELQAKEIKQ
jgi:uncharacterized protein involved in outer membrane biogenesis